MILRIARFGAICEHFSATATIVGPVTRRPISRSIANDAACLLLPQKLATEHSVAFQLLASALEHRDVVGTVSLAVLDVQIKATDRSMGTRLL